MMSIIWPLCRRHWLAFAALTFWYAGPWLTAAIGFDLSHALRFSWLASAPFAIYMYQVTSGSQLLGILPLARREVWQITCLVGALVPAMIQFVVATAILLLASVLLPADTTLNLAGMDTMVLGAAYSLAFLQLVLIATASLRRRRLVTAALAMAALGIMAWLAPFLPSSISAFTTTSAVAFWVAAVVAVVIVRVPGALAAPAPARPPTYRLALDLPAIGVLDRLTGVKRILLVHTLFGVMCLGASLALLLLMPEWQKARPAAERAADELRAFSGNGGWVLRPGDSWVFLAMWIIGLVNVWTPMARQMRALPLTLRETNVLFLSAPIAIWTCVWAMLVGTYAVTVGGPMTLRIDLFLAVSGTSTLANVMSLRWKNRLYGMSGVAFIYSFWAVASIAALVLNLTEATIPLVTTGIVFYAAAVSLNHNTLVHATSASAAYQRQPKFFDTPARS